jgi:inorganic pyrophosphatase
MENLIELSSWDEDGNLRVVVEAPKGSKAKLHYQPRFGIFELQRLLPGAGYPYDWGFVPSTRAEDGDPLDAMVIYDGHTFPGVVIPSVPIAILNLSELKPGAQKPQRNDRLIAVPALQPRPASLAELEPRTRDELEQFFKATGPLAKKEVQIVGWGGASEARSAVEKAAAAYQAR